MSKKAILGNNCLGLANNNFAVDDKRFIKNCNNIEIKNGNIYFLKGYNNILNNNIRLLEDRKKYYYTRYIINHKIPLNDKITFRRLEYFNDIFYHPNLRDLDYNTKIEYEFLGKHDTIPWLTWEEPISSYIGTFIVETPDHSLYPKKKYLNFTYNFEPKKIQDKEITCLDLLTKSLAKKANLEVKDYLEKNPEHFTFLQSKRLKRVYSLKNSNLKNTILNKNLVCGFDYEDVSYIISEEDTPLKYFETSFYDNYIDNLYMKDHHKIITGEKWVIEGTSLQGNFVSHPKTRRIDSKVDFDNTVGGICLEKEKRFQSYNDYLNKQSTFYDYFYNSIISLAQINSKNFILGEYIGEITKLPDGTTKFYYFPDVKLPKGTINKLVDNKIYSFNGVDLYIYTLPASIIKDNKDLNYIDKVKYKCNAMPKNSNCVYVDNNQVMFLNDSGYYKLNLLENKLNTVVKLNNHYTLPSNPIGIFFDDELNKRVLWYGQEYYIDNGITSYEGQQIAIFSKIITAELRELLNTFKAHRKIGANELDQRAFLERKEKNIETNIISDNYFFDGTKILYFPKLSNKFINGYFDFKTDIVNPLTLETTEFRNTATLGREVVNKDLFYKYIRKPYELSKIDFYLDDTLNKGTFYKFNSVFKNKMWERDNPFTGYDIYYEQFSDRYFSPNVYNNITKGKYNKFYYLYNLNYFPFMFTPKYDSTYKHMADVIKEIAIFDYNLGANYYYRFQHESFNDSKLANNGTIDIQSLNSIYYTFIKTPLVYPYIEFRNIFDNSKNIRYKITKLTYDKHYNIKVLTNNYFNNYNTLYSDYKRLTTDKNPFGNFKETLMHTDILNLTNVNSLELEVINLDVYMDKEKSINIEIDYDIEQIPKWKQW